jgi:peptidoglycan/xylan/chitin deacetylase (PgdA/CDA1 family)
MVVHVERVLLGSPLQAVFRWRAGNRLAVLAYHAVDDEDSFSRHLDYVRAHCNPVSLDEVLAAIAGETRLPRHAVLITFDDADRTVLDRAVPLVRERGLPAVAFVVTGHLDGRQPFWWAEVEHLVRAGATASGFEGLGSSELVRRMKLVPEERRRSVLAELRRTSPGPTPDHRHLRSEDLGVLQAAGVAIGNHTVTHPCLPRCSDEEVRKQIVKAHESIVDVTGSEPAAFAYPNGDWDPRAERILTELGYRAAFLFDHALTRPGRDPLRLSRVRTDSTVSQQRLELIVSGLHPALHRLRERVSKGSPR